MPFPFGGYAPIPLGRKAPCPPLLRCRQIPPAPSPWRLWHRLDLSLAHARDPVMEDVGQLEMLHIERPRTVWWPAVRGASDVQGRGCSINGKFTTGLPHAIISAVASCPFSLGFCCFLSLVLQPSHRVREPLTSFSLPLLFKTSRLASSCWQQEA